MTAWSDAAVVASDHSLCECWQAFSGVLLLLWGAWPHSALQLQNCCAENCSTANVAAGLDAVDLCWTQQRYEGNACAGLDSVEA